MATIEQRIAELERKAATPLTIHSAVAKRPKITRDEWVEIQQKTGFQGKEYPTLVRELLAKRGDGSEIKHAEYLRNLELRFEEEEHHGDN